MWTRSCCRCMPAGSPPARSAPTSPRCTGPRSAKTPSPGSPTRCWRTCRPGPRRPLQRVYAAIFIDAIVVKVRDGQVGNQPFYAAIGVNLSGHRDVLGRGRGRWWGEREVLDERAHRLEEPRRGRCVLRRLRWAEKPAGQRERGVPGRDRSGLHHPPDPWHLPLRLETVLGAAGQGPAPDLHRADRGHRVGGVRGTGGEVGQALPGDTEAALTVRLG